MVRDSSTSGWRQPADRAEESRTSVDLFGKAVNKLDPVEDRKGKKGKKHNQHSVMLTEGHDHRDGLPAERRRPVPAPTLNITASGLRWPILLLRQGPLLLVEGIDARYGLRGESRLRILFAR